MSGKRVNVETASGAIGTVDESEASAVAAPGGQVITPEQASAEMDARARGAKAGVQLSDAKDLPEAWLAGLHGDVRGTLGTIGIPVDRAATGVASFFGEGAEKSTREYLKGLDERHPLASGWMEMMGGARGSIGAAEFTGLGRLPGALGVGARAGAAGVENVIQSTTRDINEDALGNAKVNGEKLYARLGERFLLGVGLGLGFEGAAAGLGAGWKALSKRAAPALEAGADAAIGREVGLAGEEAQAAGGRIRALSREHAGAEIPKGRTQLAEVLEAGQAAERKGIRAEAETAGRKLVSETETAVAEGTLDAMAKGGARVEQAEIAAAERLRAAHGEAMEAHLAASKAAGRAGGGALQEEMAAAGQAYESVVGKYAKLQTTIASEMRAAEEQALALEGERAANAKALAEAMKQGSKETGPPGQLTKAEFEEIVDTMAGITGGRKKGKVDPNQRWAAEKWVRDTYGEPIEEAALVQGRGEEVARLQSLAKHLEDAHGEALGRVTQAQSAMRQVDTQAAKDIRAAGQLADQRVAQFQRTVAQDLSKAEKGAGKASDNVAKVKAEVEASVERARGKGQAEAAAAEAAGKKKIAAAEAQAEKIRARAETAPTSVDPLLAGAKAAQAAKAPLVSPWAAWTSFMSAAHGNVAGAAAGLLSSFAAGRARAHSNLATARALRLMSEAVTGVDNAIRAGTAKILGLGGADAAAHQLSKEPEEKKPSPKQKEPSFEEVADQVRTTAAHPAILEQRVQSALGPVALQVPNTYASTLMAAQRANEFLLSILPDAQRDPNSLTPQLETGDVPDTLKYDFMRSYRTISDPLSIYEDIHDGSVVDRQIQALEAVHTGMFKQMVGEVNRQRMYLTSPLDYERAISVGTLLGVTTNQVMDPDFQRAMRAAYDDKAKAGEPLGSAPKSGTKLDRNMLSTSQRLESGESR